jgi:uncharacterized protein with PIN domain
MIIDTSAIIAILRDEAGASDCALAIEKTRSQFKLTGECQVRHACKILSLSLQSNLRENPS